MKPIKLTISAFEPYAEEECIDFRALDSEGIYLIAGDTGSGKTTIFDAIIFALFGAASGSARNPSMFRCKYASPNTKTFVELVFGYGGKTYTVKRSLVYKQKSDENAAPNTDACLTLPDGSVITKTKMVAKEIENLLGLDYKRFSQVAMLSQGEFLKLLFSPTSDRIEVFRSIFHTEKYLDLQKRIYSDLDIAKDERESAENYINKNLSAISCEDEDYAEKLSEIKSHPLLYAPNDISKLIAEIISSDNEKAAIAEKRINALDNSISENGVKLGRAEARRNAENSLKISEQSLKEAQSRLPSIKAKLAEAEKIYPEYERLAAEISREKERLGDYALLEQYRRSKKSAELAMEKAAALRRSAENQSAELSKQLELYRNELSEVKTSSAEKERLIGQRDSANQMREELKNLACDLVKSENLEAEAKEAKDAYISAQNNAKQIQAEYLYLEKLFLDEQAGVLASKLTDGVPCPVCGSLSHPAPAHFSETAPSEQQLDQASKRSEAARANASKLSLLAGERSGKAETEKLSVLSRAKEFFGEIAFENLKPAIKKRHSLVTNKFNELSLSVNNEAAKEKRFLELERIIPNAEAKQKSLEAKISSYTAEAAAAEATVRAANENIGKLFPTLKFPDEKAAEEHIKDLEKRKEQIKNAYDNANQNFSSCESEIKRLSAAAEAYRSQLENGGSENLDELRSNQAALTAERQSLDARRIEILSRLSTNSSSLKQINEHSAAFEKAEKRYIMLKSLSDTASGTISGKEKITLETHIQAVYLNKITNRANVRLLEMTDGRYELIRSEADGNLRGKSGLELDVIDHYNGSVRSVKTLSGGEAFEASLSLALGLSDEIQSAAGGIRLDTMFVDEGFGTLDEEALGKAMDALCRLSAGGRTVGIISHVAELKERIGNQIIVTKNKRSGSSHINVSCDN